MRACNKTSTVVFEEKTTAILEAGRAHLRVGPLEHSGPHILAITLNHAHVAGSPFVLSVEAAAASAEHSSFEGDECRAVAGERAVMILVCRDAMGNALTVGGAVSQAQRRARGSNTNFTLASRWHTRRPPLKRSGRSTA